MARRSSYDKTPKKDFIFFKGGGQFKFVPQTARGWRWMGIWSLILMLPVVPFAILAISVDDTPNESWVLWALIPLFAAMGVLIFAMVRWMLARSETITMADVAEWKREKEGK